MTLQNGCKISMALSQFKSIIIHNVDSTKNLKQKQFLGSFLSIWPLIDLFKVTKANLKYHFRRALFDFGVKNRGSH